MLDAVPPLSSTANRVPLLIQTHHGEILFLNKTLDQVCCVPRRAAASRCATQRHRAESHRTDFLSFRGSNWYAVRVLNYLKK